MTVSDGGCGLTERGAKTMKKNSQHSNDRASKLDSEQKSPSDAPKGSGLRDVFQRYRALDAEGKLLNDHKAALFARAKVDGYNPKDCEPPSDSLSAKWNTQRRPRSTVSSLTAICGSYAARAAVMLARLTPRQYRLLQLSLLLTLSRARTQTRVRVSQYHMTRMARNQPCGYKKRWI
jgi:hypothetical protein